MHYHNYFDDFLILQVPLNAVLESENIYWPQIGLDSDCDPKTTVRFIAVNNLIKFVRFHFIFR